MGDTCGWLLMSWCSCGLLLQLRCDPPPLQVQCCPLQAPLALCHLLPFLLTTCILVQQTTNILSFGPCSRLPSLYTVISNSRCGIFLARSGLPLEDRPLSRHGLDHPTSSRIDPTSSRFDPTSSQETLRNPNGYHLLPTSMQTTSRAHHGIIVEQLKPKLTSKC